MVILKVGVVVAATTGVQFLTFLFISETVQLALVGSVVPTIAAVGAILIGWWANRKIAMDAVAAAKQNAIAIGAVETKTDKVIEQGVQIHEVTNSNLTKVTNQLEVALERIKGMDEVIKTMVAAKSVADDLSTKKVEQPSKAPVAIATGGTSGGEPTPVVDQQVADLIRGDVTDKLKVLQETANETKK